MPTVMRLLRILTYPVKSTRFIEVDRAEVESRGLRGDRRWMVVDQAGRFVSQREVPRLTLIEARLTETGMQLSVPGRAPFVIKTPPARSPRIPVEIWDDTVHACPAGDEAAAVLSDYLGQDVRLVYMDEAARRPVDPAYAREGDEVSFADGFPLLLCTAASLQALNARLDTPVGMERFRPNLVVDGTHPFEEDHWTEIVVGAVPFRVVKPCARCVVTTADPATGATGKEPLRTLATFRRTEGKVYFGQNLIPQREGVLHRGEPVRVIR